MFYLKADVKVFYMCGVLLLFLKKVWHTATFAKKVMRFAIVL